MSWALDKWKQRWADRFSLTPLHSAFSAIAAILDPDLEQSGSQHLSPDPIAERLDATGWIEDADTNLAARAAARFELLCEAWAPARKLAAADNAARPSVYAEELASLVESKFAMAARHRTPDTLLDARTFSHPTDPETRFALAEVRNLSEQVLEGTLLTARQNEAETRAETNKIFGADRLEDTTMTSVELVSSRHGAGFYHRHGRRAAGSGRDGIEIRLRVLCAPQSLCVDVHDLELLNMPVCVAATRRAWFG